MDTKAKAFMELSSRRMSVFPVTLGIATIDIVFSKLTMSNIVFLLGWYRKRYPLFEFEENEQLTWRKSVLCHLNTFKLLYFHLTPAKVLGGGHHKKCSKDKPIRGLDLCVSGKLLLRDDRGSDQSRMVWYSPLSMNPC